MLKVTKTSHCAFCDRKSARTFIKHGFFVNSHGELCDVHFDEFVMARELKNKYKGWF